MKIYKEYDDGRTLVTNSLGKSRDPEWKYRVLIIYLDENPVDAEIIGSKIDKIDPDKEANFNVSDDDYRNAFKALFEKLKVSA